MKIICRRVLCAALAGLLALGLSSCGLPGSSDTEGTTQPAVSKPAVDADVSDVLRAFYQDQLPTMALKSGVQDSSGNEIRCDFSMLQKSVFADFDADGQKEIVLLYDVSEQTGEKNLDVCVMLDEKDGAPVVVGSHSGSYGATKDSDTTYILTWYNSRVSRVRFINRTAYEAVLIDIFEDGVWKTAVSAYKHVTDHDGVKLENDSCYIDHAGDGLFKAATGQTAYSREKYLNFRTPNENFDGLITSLLAETLLP